MLVHPLDPKAKEAFTDLLLGSAEGTFRIFSIYLGLKLGYYDALSRGPCTPRTLANACGTDVRYAREWLEQQAVARVLDAEADAADADERRFTLPAAHAVVLGGESLDDISPLVRLLVGATRPLDDVVQAYRTGGGVPYGAYGVELREGQASMNKAMFMELLPTEWIAAMPDVRARLKAAGARVADVGCGAGWSSIGMAKTFPQARVDGFDLDPPSIELARSNARREGVGESVSFEVRDAADPAYANRYDLVMALECIHDMSRPVDALRAMRGMCVPGGAVLVVDERVGDAFTPRGEGLEWMMYGWSVLHCLPVGMAEKPSAATGTVLRPGLMRKYAEDAGYQMIETLPVENAFFRLYRLTP